MIKLQIDKGKGKGLVKIFDCNKNVNFELEIGKDGEYYYAPEDIFYSSLTAFIKDKIENPEPVEVEFND